MIEMLVECRQCGFNNKREVSFLDPDLFSGEIVKAIWCDKCGCTQALKYRFTEEGEAEITERIAASEVYKRKKPETGITIKPRGKK